MLSLLVSYRHPRENYLGISPKIIAGNYSFDINGTFPPYEVFNLDGYDYIVDGSGNVFAYWFVTIQEDPSTTVYNFHYHQLVSIDSISGLISAETDTTVNLPFTSDTTTAYIVSPAEQIYVNAGGFLTVTAGSSGITASVTAVTIPMFTTPEKVYYDGALYWLVGNEIHHFELSSSGTDTTIYTNANIATPTTGDPISVTGGNIIFYAYADATTVNTYSLPVDGPYTPELLTTSTADIKDIVELEF
jgi:hypothetical protein